MFNKKTIYKMAKSTQIRPKQILKSKTENINKYYISILIILLCTVGLFTLCDINFIISNHKVATPKPNHRFIRKTSRRDRTTNTQTRLRQHNQTTALTSNSETLAEKTSKTYHSLYQERNSADTKQGRNILVCMCQCYQMEFTLKGYVCCCIYASVHFKTEVCVV